MRETEFIAQCEALIAAGTKPKDSTPIKALVRWYEAQPGNGAGGSLHNVLDDGNIEDSNVDFCVGYAREKSDRHGELLARVLRLCSKTQRDKVR